MTANDPQSGNDDGMFGPGNGVWFVVALVLMILTSPFRLAWRTIKKLVGGH